MLNLPRPHWVDEWEWGMYPIEGQFQQTNNNNNNTKTKYLFKSANLLQPKGVIENKEVF